MTQENKELLLKDICARLPYGIRCAGWLNITSDKDVDKVYPWVDGELMDGITDSQVRIQGTWIKIEFVRPYLRPMTSMTDKEKKDLLNYVVGKGSKYFEVCDDVSITDKSSDEQDVKSFELKWINFNPNTTSRYIEWLLKNHFDFCNLIPKSLALPAPEGMYKI